MCKSEDIHNAIARMNEVQLFQTATTEDEFDKKGYKKEMEKLNQNIDKVMEILVNQDFKQIKKTTKSKLEKGENDYAQKEQPKCLTLLQREQEKIKDLIAKDKRKTKKEMKREQKILAQFQKSDQKVNGKGKRDQLKKKNKNNGNAQSNSKVELKLKSKRKRKKKRKNSHKKQILHQELFEKQLEKFQQQMEEDFQNCPKQKFQPNICKQWLDQIRKRNNQSRRSFKKRNVKSK